MKGVVTQPSSTFPLTPLANLVAGPGVEPGLEDYEPSVQPYTTPHIVKQWYYITKFVKIYDQTSVAWFI